MVPVQKNGNYGNYELQSSSNSKLFMSKIGIKMSRRRREDAVHCNCFHEGMKVEKNTTKKISQRRKDKPRMLHRCFCVSIVDLGSAGVVCSRAAVFYSSGTSVVAGPLNCGFVIQLVRLSVDVLGRNATCKDM